MKSSTALLLLIIIGLLLIIVDMKVYKSDKLAKSTAPKYKVYYEYDVYRTYFTDSTDHLTLHWKTSDTIAVDTIYVPINTLQK